MHLGGTQLKEVKSAAVLTEKRLQPFQSSTKNKTSNISEFIATKPVQLPQMFLRGEKKPKQNSFLEICDKAAIYMRCVYVYIHIRTHLVCTRKTGSSRRSSLK